MPETYNYSTDPYNNTTTSDYVPITGGDEDKKDKKEPLSLFERIMNTANAQREARKAKEINFIEPESYTQRQIAVNPSFEYDSDTINKKLSYTPEVKPSHTYGLKSGGAVKAPDDWSEKSFYNPIQDGSLANTIKNSEPKTPTLDKALTQTPQETPVLDSATDPNKKEVETPIIDSVQDQKGMNTGATTDLSGGKPATQGPGLGDSFKDEYQYTIPKHRPEHYGLPDAPQADPPQTPPATTFQPIDISDKIKVGKGVKLVRAVTYPTADVGKYKGGSRMAGDAATDGGAAAGNQARNDLKIIKKDRDNPDPNPVVGPNPPTRRDELSQQYDAEIFNKEKGIVGQYFHDYVGQGPMEKGGDEAAYMKGMKDNWVNRQLLGEQFDKEVGTWEGKDTDTWNQATKFRSDTKGGEYGGFVNQYAADNKDKKWDKAFFGDMKESWIDKQQLSKKYDEEIFNKENGVVGQHFHDYVGASPMEKGGDEAAYIKGMKDDWMSKQTGYAAGVKNKIAEVQGKGKTPAESFAKDKAAQVSGMEEASSGVDKWGKDSKQKDFELKQYRKNFEANNPGQALSAEGLEEIYHRRNQESVDAKAKNEAELKRREEEKAAQGSTGTGLSAIFSAVSSIAKDKKAGTTDKATDFAKNKAAQVTTSDKYQNTGLMFNKEAKEWQHRGTGKTATGKERADQVGHYGAYTEEGREGIGYGGTAPKGHEKGSDAYYGAEFSQSHGRGSKWTEHQQKKDPTLDTKGLKSKWIEQRRAFDTAGSGSEDKGTTFAKDKAKKVSV